MKTYSASLVLCVGNSWVTGEFPEKGQRRKTLMFSLICACTNGWVNNRDAGDLTRHPTHYDITVINSFVSVNGLSPVWCQNIIWTNAVSVLVGPMLTNCSAISTQEIGGKQTDKHSRYHHWEVYLFSHDDVIKWKHFQRFRPFARGINRSPANSSYAELWCFLSSVPE